MDPDDFPTPDEPVDELTPETLKGRIDDGEDVTILDARASGDFEEDSFISLADRMREAANTSVSEDPGEGPTSST